MLDAGRVYWQERDLPTEEDMDGNFLTNSTTATILYDYETSKIPAVGIENLLKLVVVPEQLHQCLLLFHQQVQGKFMI